MNYEWAMLSHSLLSLIHVVYIKSESSGRWKLELFETKLPQSLRLASAKPLRVRLLTSHREELPGASVVSRER